MRLLQQDAGADRLYGLRRQAVKKGKGGYFRSFSIPSPCLNKALSRKRLCQVAQRSFSLFHQVDSPINDESAPFRYNRNGALFAKPTPSHTAGKAGAAPQDPRHSRHGASANPFSTKKHNPPAIQRGWGATAQRVFPIRLPLTFCKITPGDQGLFLRGIILSVGDREAWHFSNAENHVQRIIHTAQRL